ncbi:hypothetical protein PP304_gp190 [Gordonia phage Phendrix]|uniref:Uncharacterized protein n=2 Tax=Godonkavirus TaxID=2733178 RepID=A0A4D6E3Z3_9CAUD|nr:hypothetical protein HOV33_gp194 [Gordonia phage GodonK]YP_010649177.1 hypothetical protein PP304_gp190 [Gordonia phage Phendrix]QBZ72762.1 hypothetical protein SEA_GODONK_174 [Gordonia phage GodonK]QDK02680.1 hypothetical protein SEA_PHENDRIX_163 [Gordonia phage Phendrix]
MKKLTNAVFAAGAVFAFTFVGATVASADPCRMDVGNGQFAPCPPPIVSTSGANPGHEPGPRKPENQRIHIHVDSDDDGVKDDWVVSEGTNMRDAIDNYEESN